MPTPPRVLPIACPLGSGSTAYVYYLDTPEPALIDTGVAASPAGTIGPALAAAGLRLRDVRWILATHGHWDHIGGAHATRALTGGEGKVAIHQQDLALLADRRRHMPDYFGVRFRFVDEPEALARTDALVLESISGELGADRVVADGDRIGLGGGYALSAVHTPGHSPGSVTYVLEGAEWAFAGDAVQVCGTSGSRFPLFVRPGAYRTSVRRLLEDVRPARLHLGHAFLDDQRQPLPPTLHGEAIAAALGTSLEMHEWLARAAERIGGDGQTLADFAPAAAALGYSPDQPAAWPAPFFTTLGGYLADRVTDEKAGSALPG